jgi:hypothetical protein
MSAGIITGNVRALGVAAVPLSPALVAANTTAEQTFTVPGVIAGDVVSGVSKPTAQAGLGIVNARVSAANTVAITFSNNTGAGITPTAGETYLITLVRPEATFAGFASA